MTGREGVHTVQIVGAAQVPYHYRLIARQRDLEGADLLSSKDGVAETQLPVGSFLCYAEDLTTGVISTTKINISGTSVDPVVVELGERPKTTSVISNFRPSRVQAYQSFRTASALSGEIDEDLVPIVSPNFSDPAKQISRNAPLSSRLEKRFSIGLSIDLTSARRGGWRAFERLEGLQLRQAGHQIVLDFGALAFRPKERLRLSVSVEGDHVWQVNLPLFDAGLIVEVPMVKSRLGPELGLRLVVPDPSLALVLAGSLGSFSGGLERISGFQSDRSKNPSADPWTGLSWILAGVRSGVTPQLPGDGPWPWPRFDPISDGYVVWAWITAASADKASVDLDRRCLDILVEARKLGRPYFSATSELAVELLQALASASRDPAIRANAKYEALIWSRRGKTKLKTGPFFSWERSGQNMQNGKLPAGNYTTLVSGQLGANRLDVASILK
ncbi:hypothetical protein HFN51_36295 [Rhizobium leguminosarum]|nr:hypothetical protein [Rhizobium leguminosarum]